MAASVDCLALSPLAPQTTKDGLRLHAWLMWPRHWSAEERRRRPTVLFCQENAGNMAFRWAVGRQVGGGVAGGRWDSWVRAVCCCNAAWHQRWLAKMDQQMHEKPPAPPVLALLRWFPSNRTLLPPPVFMHWSLTSHPCFLPSSCKLPALQPQPSFRVCATSFATAAAGCPS